MAGQRACLYLRVSSAEQAEGHSLEAQRSEGRDYCDRHGYRVTRIFNEGKSAKDGDRPVFQHMIDVAQRGGFDVLVVWKRDRFFRNAIEAGFYERILRGYGVRVEDVARGPQVDTPAVRFQNLIIDGVAELERSYIAERCAMGRRSAAQAGEWPARALYGYRKEGKRLAIDLAASQKVREAYLECIRGANRARLGIVLACDPRSSCRILRNPAYKGQAVYSGIPVPCPPIVEEAVWQAAQDAMDARFQGCDAYGRLLSRGPSSN